MWVHLLLSGLYVLAVVKLCQFFIEVKLKPLSDVQVQHQRLNMFLNWDYWKQSSNMRCSQPYTMSETTIPPVPHVPFMSTLMKDSSRCRRFWTLTMESTCVHCARDCRIRPCPFYRPSIPFPLWGTVSDYWFISIFYTWHCENWN